MVCAPSIFDYKNILLRDCQTYIQTALCGIASPECQHLPGTALVTAF